MERLENTAKEWLKNEQSVHNCTVETKNGALFFTVATDQNNVSFSINHDTEADTWMVWSDHTEIQAQLGEILEFCESSRPKDIELLLTKMFTIVNQVLKEMTDNDEEEEGDDDDDDDDDDNDGYYDEMEGEVLPKPDIDTAKYYASGSDESGDEDSRFFGGGANATACHRLMKDLKNMRKEAHKFCMEGNPRGNNLFLWDVKLTQFPTDTRLGKDITEWARKSNREPVVYLEMQFPGDYPMKPPFVRVIRPRFKFLTGHVTIGGSICMEMLTSTGWTPTNDIESILVQIRSEIMSDPNSRLDSNPDREYKEDEARDAFNRMVARYGWK